MKLAPQSSSSSGARQPLAPESGPERAVSTGLGLFAAALLLLIVVGSVTQRFRPGPQGIALTELLGILLPALLFVEARRWRVLRFLRLWPVTARLPLAIVGGALLGAGCFYALAVWIEPLLELFIPVPEAERLQLLRLLRPASGLRPLWQDLLCFAAVPALCEEVLFRGVILSLLLPTQRRLEEKSRGPLRSVVAAVLLCAALFGIFHLSWSKLLPTALLGIGFGAAAIWSGSLWPAMVMHFANNALVVIFVRVGVDEAPSSTRHLLEKGAPVGLGALLLLAAAGATLLGYRLLQYGKAGRPGGSDQD